MKLENVESLATQALMCTDSEQITVLLDRWLDEYAVGMSLFMERSDD